MASVSNWRDMFKNGGKRVLAVQMRGRKMSQEVVLKFFLLLFFARAGLSRPIKINPDMCNGWWIGALLPLVVWRRISLQPDMQARCQAHPCTVLFVSFPTTLASKQTHAVFLVQFWFKAANVGHRCTSAQKYLERRETSSMKAYASERRVCWLSGSRKITRKAWFWAKIQSCEGGGVVTFFSLLIFGGALFGLLQIYKYPMNPASLCSYHSKDHFETIRSSIGPKLHKLFAKIQRRLSCCQAVQLFVRRVVIDFEFSTQLLQTIRK